MEEALREAEKGLGRTSPNPAVGAILVRDGVIIARGYHHKAGTPHAEVHAIRAAGGQGKGARLYVTLEPCNHTGRTPPCTEAILRAGITEVVIGMLDPNPHVSGNGAKYLSERGVLVRSGVLEKQCRSLNYPFLKHVASGLPWVMLKAGLSLDGKITFQPRQGAALTGATAQRYVHRLRNQSDAILVGAGTALIDNPSLTTRLADTEDMRDPLRIVLDTHLRLPEKARMLHLPSSAETWIFCGEDAPEKKKAALERAGARIFCLPAGQDGRLDLTGLLRFLGNRNITSILVEGGARIHGAFYGQGLADELFLFYAPFLVGDQGMPLISGYSLERRPTWPVLDEVSVEMLGNDLLYKALILRRGSPARAIGVSDGLPVEQKGLGIGKFETEL